MILRSLAPEASASAIPPLAHQVGFSALAPHIRPELAEGRIVRGIPIPPSGRVFHEASLERLKTGKK